MRPVTDVELVHGRWAASHVTVPVVTEMVAKTGALSETLITFAASAALGLLAAKSPHPMMKVASDHLNFVPFIAPMSL
jgi:hypothetical protein